jgi:hypothetical protein
MRRSARQHWLLLSVGYSRPRDGGSELRGPSPRDEYPSSQTPAGPVHDSDRAVVAGPVRYSVAMHAQKQYLEEVRKEYERADQGQRGRLSDQAQRRTKLNRKCLIRFLNGAGPPKVVRRRRRVRRRKYDATVLTALVWIWEVFARPCGQRLVAILRREVGRLRTVWGRRLRPPTSGEARLPKPRANTKKARGPTPRLPGGTAGLLFEPSQAAGLAHRHILNPMLVLLFRGEQQETVHTRNPNL